MNLELLNLRTPAVQDFLWTHLNPQHFRWNYTRMDAMRAIEQSVQAGTTYLLGDLEQGVAFRVEVANPLVCVPHLMGSPKRLREAMLAGISWAWGQRFEKIVISTQDERIARIVEWCGFERVARLPAMHWTANGELIDTMVLTLERSDGWSG